jgi:hypothetical protein
MLHSSTTSTQHWSAIIVAHQRPPPLFALLYSILSLGVFYQPQLTHQMVVANMYSTQGSSILKNSKVWEAHGTNSMDNVSANKTNTTNKYIHSSSPTHLH